MLEEAAAGEIGSIAFALPGGAGWPLPLYELALLTRAQLVDRGSTGVAISVVTPEEAPLAVFGRAAGDAVRELLEARGIELRLGATPLAFRDGALAVAPAGTVAADRVVALPRLEGPRLEGVLHDPNGFIPTDEHGQVSDEMTSGRPATRRASRSSRVGSRPSRQTPPPRRLPRAPVLRSSRVRSVPCCAACC
jgi:sulfide:quinone oxidoreductase